MPISPLVAPVIALAVLSAVPEQARFHIDPSTELYRLANRGLLRPGMAADITVFDPARVIDVATYEEPLRYAKGVDWVLVNGQVVLDGGKLTSARPGRFLTH